MARLGLLSPEFPAVSLSANLDAMAETGAVSVQFDLASAVGQTFPTELSQDTVEAIQEGFSERKLTMAALSGTFGLAGTSSSGGLPNAPHIRLKAPVSASNTMMRRLP